MQYHRNSWRLCNRILRCRLDERCAKERQSQFTKTHTGQAALIINGTDKTSVNKVGGLRQQSDDYTFSMIKQQNLTEFKTILFWPSK